MKQSRLLRIIEQEGHCQYCGAAIKFRFDLQDAEGKQWGVGSECVKSFLDKGDPEVARAFALGRWTQRRGYYYKRMKGKVWIIGPFRNREAWWVASAPTLGEKWKFDCHEFDADVLAKLYVAKQVLERGA